MLYEEKLIPREEFLQAKEDYEYEEGLLEINRLKARNDSIMLMTNMKTLDTDLQKMRQMLGLVRERLDNLEVKSPVDGQLGMLDAEIGQSVSQGQRIGMVHVLSDYKVEANVDEHYIDKVRRELPASIERNGQDYNLHVKKVYPEVRDGQFEIDLVFDDSKPENIRTGQTYHLKLQLGQATEAVMIPRGGFFQSTGGQWVFVLNESGTEAVRRNIKIGKQNPRYYEVIEGLEPGEQVITSGYEIFGENERLELR
jgi:HlyD family secretion protein